jgi:CRISPR-associated endonuclease/helicase Cas3
MNKTFKSINIENPFNFQLETVKKIENNQNILLKVPTGGGKTIGAIIPFLYMLQNSKSFPRKLIYATPLRVLTNSIYREIKDRLKESFPDLKVTIQTGEHSEDKLFEGNIIFTTIDQLLSSALAFPLSLSKSMANINAGAVFSSYLVFDEFHLLDENRALKTALSLLENIKDTTPFTVMSATFSNKFSEELAKKLSCEIVEIEEEDISKIGSLQSIKKVYTDNNEISANKILEKHKDKTIVVCNTINRAKELFIEVSEKRPHQKTILIHSQFFGSDRKEKESKLLELFGKESIDKDVILISTQVIEVGVDISCDVMHSEVSPINSLLQRAGRLARWGGSGELYIYQSENYSIYQKDLTEETFDEVSKTEELNYQNMQNLVDKILTEKELEILNQLSNIDEIKESWRNNDKSKTSDLIRSVNSINVVLVYLTEKYRFLESFETISIHPWSLKKQLEENNLKAYRLIEKQEIWGEDDFKEKEFEEIDFKSLETVFIVALDFREVGYSKEFGLDFSSKNLGVLSAENEKSRLPEYANSKDTYSQHIEAMIRVYQKEFQNLDYTIERLQKKIDYQFNFDEIVKYIIIMHDYGKLDRDWQNWAVKTQKRKNNYIEGEVLAHTDREKGEKNKTPKSHAGIGGYVSLELFLIAKDLKTKYEENFNSAIAEVITKHHSSSTKYSEDYSIKQSSLKEIQKLFTQYKLDSFLPLLEEPKKYLLEDTRFNLNTSLYDYRDINLSILTFILIRILRISDQKSFEEVKNVSE